MNLTQVSAAMIAVSASLTFVSCGGKQEQQQMSGSMAPAIATEVVAMGQTDLNNTFPATIKGKTDIDIRPQVSGFITKVHVDEGQHVRKGQLLFTLDQVQFQAAVDQAEAAVNAAKTAVSTAQLTEANKRKLLDKNIISEYEWQMAANQLEQAKAQLSQAQAALTTAYSCRSATRER